MKRRVFLTQTLGGLLGLHVSFSLPRQTSNTSDILVQVLGTAQDGGIPQIGCFCSNCLRAREDSRFARLISSIGILDLKENKGFIVDATPDIRKQYDRIHSRLGRLKTGRRNIPAGIVLSHAHIGHYSGLIFYGYESLSTQGLPVFCSEKMKDFLSSQGPWDQLVNLNNIAIQPLKYNKVIELTENLRLLPFQVPHRNEYTDTLGFKIIGPKRTLLYIPDIQSWNAWDRSIRGEVEQADISLLDGTFFGPEELPGRDLTKIGHPFITTSMEILGETVRSGGNRILFTHLNHTNLALDKGSEERKIIIESGFDLASDGMEFFL